jgi:hypothetical protein
MSKNHRPNYIVWLHGGLGNQLFQWAMATAMAQRHGGHAWGDRSYLAQDTLRKYALDQFTIDFPEPPEHLVEKIIGRPRYMDTPGDRRHPLIRKFYNFRQSLLPWQLRDCVLEQDMRYQPRIAKRKKSLYLDGFWQNQRYFSDCIPHLRRQLILRERPPESWKKWWMQMAEWPAIGVHIRRGDYITNDYVANRIGPCDEDYYRRGVAHHRATDPTRKVFLFTDDPAWAQEKFSRELRNDNWHLVSGTGTWNEAAEMTLLSYCSFFVLSNSSFSWWAAWLSGTVGENIIVPDPWYNDPAMRHIHPAPITWLRHKKSAHL